MTKINIHTIKTEITGIIDDHANAHKKTISSTGGIVSKGFFRGYGAFSRTPEHDGVKTLIEQKFIHYAQICNEEEKPFLQALQKEISSSITEQFSSPNLEKELSNINWSFVIANIDSSFKRSEKSIELYQSIKDQEITFSEDAKKCKAIQYPSVKIAKITSLFQQNRQSSLPRTKTRKNAYHCEEKIQQLKKEVSQKIAQTKTELKQQLESIINNQLDSYYASSIAPLITKLDHIKNSSDTIINFKECSILQTQIGSVIEELKNLSFLPIPPSTISSLKQILQTPSTNPFNDENIPSKLQGIQDECAFLDKITNRLEKLNLIQHFIEQYEDIDLLAHTDFTEVFLPICGPNSECGFSKLWAPQIIKKTNSWINNLKEQTAPALTTYLHNKILSLGNELTAIFTNPQQQTFSKNLSENTEKIKNQISDYEEKIENCQVLLQESDYRHMKQSLEVMQGQALLLTNYQEQHINLTKNHEALLSKLQRPEELKESLSKLDVKTLSAQNHEPTSLRLNLQKKLVTLVDNIRNDISQKFYFSYQENMLRKYQSELEKVSQANENIPSLEGIAKKEAQLNSIYENLISDFAFIAQEQELLSDMHKAVLGPMIDSFCSELLEEKKTLTMSREYHQIIANLQSKDTANLEEGISQYLNFAKKMGKYINC